MIICLFYLFSILICDLPLCFSQLTLLANLTLAKQRTLKLPAREAVHHIMTFDPNDSNFLYVMTSHHVSARLLTGFQSLQMFAGSLHEFVPGRLGFGPQEPQSEHVRSFPASPPHPCFSKHKQICGEAPSVCLLQSFVSEAPCFKSHSADDSMRLHLQCSESLVEFRSLCFLPQKLLIQM